MKKIFYLFSIVLLIGFFVDRASAQDSFAPRMIGIDKLVGGVAAAVPDYEGSDDYSFVLAPMIQYKFDGSNRYAQLIANKLYFNVLNQENWEFGPMGIYRSGRDDDVDDEIVKLMKEVDDSFEVGAFLGYAKKFGNNPRHRMNIHLDVTQDLSDGHEGLVASFSGIYWKPVAEAWDIGFGGNVTYASDDYMSAFFDVSASDATITGLQPFKAEEGFKDLGVKLMGMYHLSKSWHVAGGLQYKKLLGDAEDSPVVDKRGDANQLLAGLALLYSW
jgi:outer membrane protein